MQLYSIEFHRDKDSKGGHYQIFTIDKLLAIFIDFFHNYNYLK